VQRLIEGDSEREAMGEALAYWHSPLAAGLIAEKILTLLPEAIQPRQAKKRILNRGRDIEAMAQRDAAEDRRKAELESA